MSHSPSVPVTERHFYKVEGICCWPGCLGVLVSIDVSIPSSFLVALQILDFLLPKLSVLSQAGILGIYHKMGPYSASPLIFLEKSKVHSFVSV